MRKVFGLRTVFEAAFLVAVPVVVLAVGKSPSVIIAAAGLGYLLVLLLEVGIWRARPADARMPDDAAPSPPPAKAETVRVLPAEPQAPISEPALPEPTPAPTPEPVAAEQREAEHVRVLRPVPELPPEPEPEPASAPPQTPPQTPPQAVVPIGVGSDPRQWNLWDLERLVREHGGHDEARDEERSFLLMYLRDFAGPDGLLPIDFDGLVRDSFGDLVGAR